MIFLAIKFNFFLFYMKKILDFSWLRINIFSFGGSNAANNALKNLWFLALISVGGVRRVEDTSFSNLFHRRLPVAL